MKQTLLTALMIGMIAFIGQAQDYKTFNSESRFLAQGQGVQQFLKDVRAGF